MICYFSGTLLNLLPKYELVNNETRFNGESIHVKARPKEVKEASCSSDKARNLLNYKTKTSLKESIKLTADFIRSKGTRKFNYNLPIEIKSEITPETWTKKII